MDDNQLDKLHDSLGYDLVAAIEYNPMDNFGLDDLVGARIDLEITGEHDAKPWHWLLQLSKGWAYVTGSCDYTGWD